ncbi:type II toxin-antitoxin system RelB/DinJ family antitoxin (plasmid) [Legionella sp. D16C41]|uniref:type II toxin-antitoxin system RelB/DinJ family antitoxin n=1 Tax=Legionella sp. D16C41 TaxID=3402688 RepID=UPI003AF7C081
MKTETVRARIEPSLKYEVEGVLNSLGLTMSEAIELYLCQIKLRKGIPFDIRIPNEVTLKTFNSTDKEKNLNRYDNPNEMFNNLGI